MGAFARKEEALIAVAKERDGSATLRLALTPLFVLKKGHVGTCDRYIQHPFSAVWTSLPCSPMRDAAMDVLLAHLCVASPGTEALQEEFRGGQSVNNASCHICYEGQQLICTNCSLCMPSARSS